MASPSPALVDLDNDGFDWEAALEEIDSVFRNKAPETPNREVISRPLREGPVAGAVPVPAKADGQARQCTLDSFFDSRQKREDSPCFPGRRDGLESAQEVFSVQIDLDAAKTWLYPVNVPHRDYQFSITKCALFSNTLVALPTGLGKTFIAAVVMYNYFRWFPKGKIIFAAPSRPLVTQQIEACHNIVGISQEWTIDMTGQMSPEKRLISWKAKRVFFVTPQVLERDIQSGICSVKQLVCLVIDEAHRALGNYSYCVAVRELMAAPVELRILALTATPGSNHHTIQSVIDNLRITVLEYRCESDPDVAPYVHNRELEFLKVPLHEDAVAVNNMLLEAIQQSVSRLRNLGVLHNRDLAEMSPCELLGSREKFRQAPPVNLSHAQYGEIEGHFTYVITVYHIRKLLLSHGIQPAFEMLREKVHHGASAGLMSRNDIIPKVISLMQYSLSHGVENPKLVKMTEILVDHFKTHDPMRSRVIIFSNFRGSVKDILCSLRNIGHLVNAAEFIGQSSGKSLKGQTQKMQQAVLQQFCNGGYNVIVATSIGEEGLDIMEVDLVICFDANVSPLRMIQRMGRTGRKHDGRVVVLACEGFEVKGYLKKQASNQVVRKHMHNGGIKSFDFHPSPRMVPHACKPEVQFIEFSIEEYIPHGKKAKDAAACQSTVLGKLTNEGKTLIARYFYSSEENRWRPSLIAFPHFQAFPSRVYKVRHSFRTSAMLIDTMQALRGLSEAKKVKESLQLGGSSANDIDERDADGVQCAVNGVSNNLFEVKIPDEDMPCTYTSNTKYELCLPDSDVQKSPVHHFIYGRGFVSVSIYGHVTVSSVPSFPHKGFSVSNDNSNESIEAPLEKSIKSASESHLHDAHNTSPIKPSKDSVEAMDFFDSKPLGAEEVFPSQLLKAGFLKDQMLGDLQENMHRANDANSEGEVANTPDVNCDIRTLNAESRFIIHDAEFSPRLTHFIEDGIVPESPAAEISFSYCKSNAINEQCPRLCSSMPETVTCPERLKSDSMYYLPELFDFSPDAPKCTGFLSNNNVGMDATPEGKAQNTADEIERKESLSSPIDKRLGTPAHLPNNCCSEEWKLNSQERAQSLPRSPKFKRLRRFRDATRKLPCHILNGNSNLSMLDVDGLTPSKQRVEKSRIARKIVDSATTRMKVAHCFIDEEAEVSNDAIVSTDEKDGENNDEYDDSFIDDRTSPSEATQAENSADMISFYRRSLLSQSPLVRLPCIGPSPTSVSPGKTGVGSCSPRIKASSLETPLVDPCQANTPSIGVNLSSYKPTRMHEEAHPQKDNPTSLCGNRKRKLTFQHGVADLSCDDDDDDDDDDDFFQSIDLDALEEQAVKLLRLQSDPSIRVNQVVAPRNPVEAKSDSLVNSSGNPTFDLGI